MSAVILLGSPGAPQVTGRLREQTFFKWLRGQAVGLLGLFVMNPPACPRSWHYYDPRFTEEETEARGGEVIMNTGGALGDLSFWF